MINSKKHYGYGGGRNPSGNDSDNPKGTFNNTNDAKNVNGLLDTTAPDLEETFIEDKASPEG